MFLALLFVHCIRYAIVKVKCVFVVFPCTVYGIKGTHKVSIAFLVVPVCAHCQGHLSLLACSAGFSCIHWPLLHFWM